MLDSTHQDAPPLERIFVDVTRDGDVVRLEIVVENYAIRSHDSVAEVFSDEEVFGLSFIELAGQAPGRLELNSAGDWVWLGERREPGDA